MRDWRPLIFLTVLLCHAAIVLFFVSASGQRLPSAPESPLVLLLLPKKARVPEDVMKFFRPAARPIAAKSNPRASKSASALDNAVTPAPEIEQPPKIDWQLQAQLAAQNAAANADKEGAYRDLSALSPAQLNWARQNHMEPAQPGIPWKYRRVEITKGGFPIIHINDHCVAIPFLMMMVFCKIGHIEPKGDLFDHMQGEGVSGDQP